MANIISDETIEYVGILAKLELSAEEKEQAKKDIGRMLDYVDKLNELDTADVEPMSHVFPVHNVFREDVVTNGDDRENMLKNAIVISDESRSDEVGLNKAVTLYMEDDDEEETYRLVTSIRGNSLSGLISTESPIGKAILGHKVGDRVEIKVSDDFSYYVVIRKIDKTESEADDKIRSF